MSYNEIILYFLLDFHLLCGNDTKFSMRRILYIGCNMNYKVSLFSMVSDQLPKHEAKIEKVVGIRPRKRLFFFSLASCLWKKNVRGWRIKVNGDNWFSVWILLLVTVQVVLRKFLDSIWIKGYQILNVLITNYRNDESMVSVV